MMIDHAIVIDMCYSWNCHPMNIWKISHVIPFILKSATLFFKKDDLEHLTSNPN